MIVCIAAVVWLAAAVGVGLLVGRAVRIADDHAGPEPSRRHSLGKS